jgi:guanylate kinase
MHHYGTNINSFKVDKTKNYVAIIDVDGANELINRLNNKFKIITIFLMPPNYAILHDRLVNRGVNDENEINRRKKIAETEIKKSHFYKYKILMDDINNEINIICKIILNEIKENTK